MIKAGTEIDTRAEMDKERVFKGKVAQLDSRIDPITRSMAARALVSNEGLTLKPGMLVMVTMHVQPRLSLSIPECALVPTGSKAFVFTLIEGKAKRLEVKTGRRKPGYVEIMTGLKEGQFIVADGLVGLQDGMEVKVAGQFTKPAAAFNPEVLSVSDQPGREK
jgi:membrane fusion protein (multidrug efflux system)